MVTLGVVPYLNAVPLTGTIGQRARLVVDVPSNLGTRLATGEVDAALVPVYEAICGVGDGYLGRYGIVSRGPVASVLLFLRTPLEAVRTLVLDPASRTSAGLARQVVAEATAGAVVGVREAEAAGADPRTCDADAVLLIGDPAMRHRATWKGSVVDLGELWTDMTGLPFVYARWTARSGLTEDERRGLATLLDDVATEGEARKEDLARAWAAARAEDPDAAAQYVREHVHYRIDRAAEAGLARYAAIVRTQAESRVTEARHA